MSIDDFFSPLTNDQFFAEYWETKPLLLSNRDRKKYAHLLCLKDVEFLLSSLTQPHISDSHRSPWVQFSREKQPQNISSYLQKGSPFLDMKKVKEGFLQGNTIILNGLQQRWEPIRKYAQDLEELFGHRVGINMYLTPSNAQAFDVHYDTHDVLVLQLDGEKHWKVYSDPLPFPVRRGETPICHTSEIPLLEAVLKPGDLLYVPRGYIHEALTTDTHSLHLTTGIHVTTWLDLISQIALQTPSLRRALPMKEIFTKGSQAIDPHHLELSFSPEVLQEALGKIQANFESTRLVSPYGCLQTEQTLN